LHCVSIGKGLFLTQPHRDNRRMKHCVGIGRREITGFNSGKDSRRIENKILGFEKPGIYQESD
jgi:hypothetical protein